MLFVISHPNTEKNLHRTKVIGCWGIIYNKKSNASLVLLLFNHAIHSLLSYTAYLWAVAHLWTSHHFTTIWICLHVFVVPLFWGLAAVDVRVLIFALFFSLISFVHSWDYVPVCVCVFVSVETCRFFTMAECGALIITYAQVSLSLSRSFTAPISIPLYPILFGFTRIASSSLGKLLFE